MGTDTPIPAQSVEDFFARVAERFSQAAQRAEVRSLDYCIAGRVVRLSFAGDALIPTITRALQHLALAPQSSADITIYLWEIASTAVELPPPPWDIDAYTFRGEIRGYSDNSHFTTYHPDGRVLYLYNTARREGFVAAFDHTLVPVYEQAAPLRPILFPALGADTIQYTHGAAVGFPEGGVVIAGKSGIGKSTTSLACLASDLQFAGDDYCALGTGNGAGESESPMAYSLYNSAKGSTATVARLPFLEPHIQLWDVGGSEKAIWFLHEQMPHKLISQFPLRAILIPRITGGRDTHVEKAPAQAAMFALSLSTYRQLPSANEQVLKRLAGLARRLPAFYLDVGTDMPQIPHQISRILKPSQEHS